MLDRAVHAAPARSAEAPLAGGDEAERGPEAATAGVGERHHRRADARRLGRLPAHGRGVARIDREHRQVEVRVASDELRPLAAAVVERDGDLLAPQVVGAREDLAFRDHHAGAMAPAAPEPDDGGSHALGHARDRVLKGLHCVHDCSQ